MAKTKTSPALSTDALKPYVQRAMTDPELREDLLAAFVAARCIYGQMAKGRGLKGKAEKVSEKDFQKQLQGLVADLSEASDKLKGKEKKSHKARNRVILLTGRDARRPLQPVDRSGRRATGSWSRSPAATAPGSRSSRPSSRQPRPRPPEATAPSRSDDRSP